MSRATACRLQGQLNTLRRLTTIRPYASQASEIPPNVKDEAAFLRAQDQAALLETQKQLDTLTDQVESIRKYLQNLPFAVSGPAIWHPTDEKKAERRASRDYPGTIPPYTLGFIRQKNQETRKVVENVTAKADHIRAHLTDLQNASYPDRSKGNSSTAAWEAEIAKMSKEQKQTRLRELRLQEQADGARLNKTSEILMDTVKAIEARARKTGKVDLDAPQKVANPFQTNAIAATSTNDAETTGKEDPSSSPGTQTTTLADMQKRLEEAMKGGG